MQNVYDAADRCSACRAVALFYCGERLCPTVFTLLSAGCRLKTGVASFVIEKSCIFCWSCMLAVDYILGAIDISSYSESLLSPLLMITLHLCQHFCWFHIV